MNPLNRPNDVSKKSPISAVPMNEGDMMMSPMTLAEVPGEMGNNKGKQCNVPPGGRAGMGTKSGDKMQCSYEGGRMYEGPAVVSKKIKMF